MSMLQRRITTGVSRLNGLPSRSPENLQGIMSCPSSPAVKKSFRLVIVGSSQTGKSSLVGRFLDNDFEDRYIPTIENFHRKLYKIKSEVYQLDILDCSGNDPFPAARRLSYLSGDMFLIVSSVDNVDSVVHMINIRKQIIDCKASRGLDGINNTPCIFILNKVDLPEHRWQTTEAEVCDLIRNSTGSNDDLVVCSAATNLNIDKAFGKVFALNKCPKYMNPEMHKKLRNELSADDEVGRRHILRRMRSRFSREHDDLTTYTDLDARRPSLRTDLLTNRTKIPVVHQHHLVSHQTSIRLRRNDDGNRCEIM
ncbi:Ras family protein [Dictyocaulus viviparus]|uniref:Ras family protein n=1 Tax=Dictyocaulus viviparus TaxID=29172 RepID=A0A0D8XEK0_DICVI|nr:Ras family protein [Dictyocaulus viviparus]